MSYKAIEFQRKQIFYLKTFFFNRKKLYLIEYRIDKIL